LAGQAYESALLAIVRAAMRVVCHAVRERVAGANTRQIQIAIKVDPLAAIAAPGLATEGFTKSLLVQRLLDRAKMFANHARSLRSGYRLGAAAGRRATSTGSCNISWRKSAMISGEPL